MTSTAILIADDHRQTRDIHERILKAWNYDVVAAHDLESAIAACRGKTISAAILDVHMPPGDIGGMEIAEWLMREHDTPAASILLISGVVEKEVRHIQAEKGWQFLQKPARLAQLKAFLDTLDPTETTPALETID